MPSQTSGYNYPPGGGPPSGGGNPTPAPPEQELIGIARRWFDAINDGDLDALDQLVAYDVVDHSGLNVAHGGGCDGHKELVRQLRDSFPGWRSTIEEITARGDTVTIRHRGRGRPPAQLKGFLGAAAGDPAMERMDFEIVSTVRIADGKIVEHWANRGPFGQKYPPPPGGGAPPYPGGGTPPYPGGGTPPYPGGGGEPPWSPGPQTENKRFLQLYVQNVIDGEAPDLARYYFSENFYNHDRAPGEEPGLAGVTAFLRSIYAAFSGFRTNIRQQIGQEDLVVGEWTQTFKNTGPYIGFPATGKQVNVRGITIVRVRDGKIVEEWEARDVVGLLEQLGVRLPLGPLEGGDGMSTSSENEEVAKTFLYQVWSEGKTDLVDQIFAPDFVNNNLLTGQKPGREGIKQFVNQFHKAIPDLSVSADLVVSEGDRVVIRYTFRGTHKGQLLGLAGSGKPVEVTGITIFRVEGGKIRESWGYWEQATLMLQIGALQLPGGQPSYPPPGPTQPPTGPYPPPEQELIGIARRWFDAINDGDLDALDQLVAYDVVDHSGLNVAHGGGCDGHKELVRQLRDSFPGWRSTIEEITARGDTVTIRHRGRGRPPAQLKGFLGAAAGDPAMERMDFEIVSTVRIADGKIVEHWANRGPFGQKSGTAST